MPSARATNFNTLSAANPNRARWCAAACSGLLSWLLYVCCLPPTVSYFGDSGELTAASYRLGIAHPSGYPFYCLLGRVWASLIPFGEVAWRYNLLSATLGALAVGFVTASAHRWLSSRDSENEAQSARRIGWASVGAGLALGGFFYFAGQCVIAEVYTLNGFFISVLLYQAIAWHQDDDWRWLYGLAFTFGLSLTAYLSGVFFVPGLFGFVMWQHRARFRHRTLRKWAIMLGLCATGFALTLYLPLRAQLFPAPPPQSGTQLVQWWPLDWGHPADFAHWKNHITAREYASLLTKQVPVSLFGRTFQMTWFAQSLALMPHKMAALLQIMALQFSWLLPLIVIGLWRSFGAQKAYASTCKNENRWFGAMLLLTWSLNIGVQINYNVDDLSSFFFPAYIMQAMWLALGLNWFLERIDSFAARLKSQNSLSAWPFRVTALSRLAIAGGLVAQWILIWPNLSLRGDTRPRDRTLERATALELLAAQTQRAPYAFIFSNDSLWTFWYAQYVLGRARQTKTPWSARGNATLQHEPLTQIVARLQPAPVVFAQWNDAIDQKFPLVSITRSGNLVRATQHVLPPKAQILTPKGAKFSARFRRTPLSVAVSVPQVLAGNIAPPQAAYKRGDLAAFDVTFRPRTLQVLAGVQPNRDQQQRAHLIGWLEVLIAQNGKISNPPPNQGKVLAPKNSQLVVNSVGETIWAWKQRRRVIVPDGAKNGAWLRANFALQIEDNAPTGDYRVWTRFVTTAKEFRTPWIACDRVRLTHR